MKNYLSMLYDAAGEEGNGMVVETPSWMLEDISLTEELIYSANLVLKSILKIKEAKAWENGIKTNIRAFISKKVSIELGDMGVLYGNLMDNAFKACCKTAQEE